MSNLRPIGHIVREHIVETTDDIARRVAIQQAVTDKLDAEPPTVQSDGDRLHLAQVRLGEISDAFLWGHTDIDNQVLRLMATLQSWAEARAREAAR